MRFANLQWLTWLYMVIPLGIFVIALLMILRKRSVDLYTSSQTVKKEIIDSVSFFKKWLKYTLLLLTIVFTIFALARPQWGTKKEHLLNRGVDIFIALDTSYSMDTPDVPPSRLEAAREEMSSLIKNLENVRVGIITFAGSAFLQCPLTEDRAASQMFLSILDTGLIPVPGTNIGSAIDLAIKAFARHSRTKKVLILLTDGENLEGNPVEEARKAASKGIIIYTIGVGTPSGQPIPIYDENGKVVDYKKDTNGNPVISRLDEVTLKKIAAVANGRYFRYTPTEKEAEKIGNEIASMGKIRLTGSIVRRYIDRYQIPLAFALFFFICEMLILERKNSFKIFLDHVKRMGLPFERITFRRQPKK